MNTAIDTAAALKRVDGDMEFLRELFGIFVEELPGLLVSIRHALRDQDPQALALAAHTIKGAAASIEATAVTEAAKQLELMGRTGDLQGSDAVLIALDVAVERFKDAVGSIA